MTKTQRAAMQQALEALENVRHYDKGNLYGLDDDITALRAALAESAFVTDNPTDIVDDQRALPLYTAPPARRPLTDKEMRHLWSLYGYKSALCMRFARAIERAHGIEEAK